MFTHYIFWLAIVSLFCFLLERFFPWRKSQKVLRPQLAQDVFWLVFNGYLWSLVSVWAMSRIPVGDKSWLGQLHAWAQPFSALKNQPLWLQVGIYLIVADFFEYLVHNILHRWGPLWRFHRVHHSLLIMDWIGNFRFHWMEHIVYKSVKFFPLVMLGARWEAALITAVISTLIGHLNHSNIYLSYGPLRYVLNSPRMHIWHHEKDLRKKGGVNFAVVFSAWDWIFRTAYFPAHNEPDYPPSEIGYHGQQNVPDDIVHRFLVPFLSGKSKRSGD